MNYLTQEYRIQNPPTSVDINVVDKTLSVLQKKYDQNSAMVEQTLALYNQNLKGLRTEENQYIASRLKEVKTQIDNYSKKNSNLAYSYNRNSMLSSVQSLLSDPIIENAITSRQNYMSYNAQVEKLKEKDGGKYYNSANVNYGLHEGGYEGYMSGKTNKLGVLNYTPYKDLTEEHLKMLKTIKDLKGKRSLEWVDPANPQVKNKKEIDGMTKDEINSYFSSLLSPEDRKQLKINGYSNYGQNEQQAKGVYTEYTKGVLQQYEKDLKVAEKDQNNTAKTAQQRESAKRDVEIKKTDIQNVKNKLLNIDKASIDDIGYELEKSSYLGGLSNMASTEWSYSQDANNVYFQNADLIVKQEKLAMDKEELLMKKQEHFLKLAKEYKIDANGNPIKEEEVSISSADTTLEKEVDGAKKLQEYHNTQVKEVRSVASEVLGKLPKGEKEAFEERLKVRGIDPLTMNFVDKDKHKNESATVTINEAFKESGLNKYEAYAIRMKKAVTEKNKAAVDIIGVEKDSYSKTFNENPDKYVNSFGTMLNEISRSSQKETFTDEEDTEQLNLRDKSNKFLTEAGGISNLKVYLKNNPLKLREFATLTDKLDNSFKGFSGAILGGLSGGFVKSFDVNLIEDSKRTTEATLKDRSNKRVLNTMTVYNNINFLKENTRGDIINKFDQGKMEGQKAFNPKLPMTARKDGENIVFEQYMGEAGTGENLKKNYSRITVGKGDSAYQTALRYIDEEQNKNVIDVDTYEVEKPYRPTTSKKDLETENNSIIASVRNTMNKGAQGIKPMFGLVGGNPEFLATASKIENSFNLVLGSKAKDEAPAFADLVANNIQNFTLQKYVAVDTEDNQLNKTFHFKILYNNKEVATKNLKVGTIDYETSYLMENFPQAFISNYILTSTYSNPNDPSIKGTKQSIKDWTTLINTSE